MTIRADPCAPAFAAVQNASLIDLPAGAIVRECWLATPGHFTHVTPYGCVVMPDHFHGMLHVGLVTGRTNDVVTKDRQIAPGSLAAVIGSFKSAATRLIRLRLGMSDAIWQRGYFDRVLYGVEDEARVRHYMEFNVTSIVRSSARYTAPPCPPPATGSPASKRPMIPPRPRTAS